MQWDLYYLNCILSLTVSLCKSNRWFNCSWVHTAQWFSVVTGTGAPLSCEQVCPSAFIKISSALDLHLDKALCNWVCFTLVIEGQSVSVV